MLLLAAGPVQAAFRRELDQISGHIRGGEWAAGREACRELRAKVSGASVPKSAFFAEFLGRCAIVAAGAGEAREASWLWHAAHFFDGRVAAAVARELAGEVSLPGVRGLARAREEYSATPMLGPVVIETGERFDGEPPQRILARSPGPIPFSQLGRPCRLVTEVIVGTDGKLHDPVLIENKRCAPTMVFRFLDAHSDWRFVPAQRDGKPVAISYMLLMQIRTES